MKRYAVTVGVLVLVLASVSIVSAQYTKYFDGHSCQPISAADAARWINRDMRVTYNSDTSDVGGSHDVFCPAEGWSDFATNPVPTGGTIYVYDSEFGGNLISCELDAVASNGAVYRSGLNSSSRLGGWQTISFGSWSTPPPSSNVIIVGYYALCTLPACPPGGGCYGIGGMALRGTETGSESVYRKSGLSR